MSSDEDSPDNAIIQNIAKNPIITNVFEEEFSLTYLSNDMKELLGKLKDEAIRDWPEVISQGNIDSSNSELDELSSLIIEPPERN